MLFSNSNKTKVKRKRLGSWQNLLAMCFRIYDTYCLYTGLIAQCIKEMQADVCVGTGDETGYPLAVRCAQQLHPDFTHACIARCNRDFKKVICKLENICLKKLDALESFALGFIVQPRWIPADGVGKGGDIKTLYAKTLVILALTGDTLIIMYFDFFLINT